MGESSEFSYLHPACPQDAAGATRSEKEDTLPDLWAALDCGPWHAALDGYAAAVAAYGTARLAGLDRWRRKELPQRIQARATPHVTLEELVGVTEWKMLRGVWRARNLQLVRANPAGEVERLSAAALAAVPDPKKPVALLAQLGGAGPATASAVLATAAPAVYPFFDEVVAAPVPGLGPVAFTAGYYQRYAAALRERAAALTAACPHQPWTPHALDLALWSAAGGKRPQPE